MPLLKTLSFKQQGWVDSYLIHGNAYQAAKEAGYKGSKHTLEVMGQENMRKPAIVAAIESARNRISYRTDVTEDSIVTGLGAIAGDSKAPHSARVQAYMGMSRILGFIVDRSESRQVSGSPDEWVRAQARAALYKQMPLDELREAVEADKLLMLPGASQEPRTEE